MKECEQQCAAIKRGICQMVPEALLNMVGYQELEEWVFGKRYIDHELLARHTAYAGGLSESDDVVIWFWETLAEMPQEQRRMFIQFCYAQPTIPPTDEEFTRRSLRLLINKHSCKGDCSCARDGHSDRRLPKAGTCFFNFELPKYSSKEVTKRQLLYAIYADNKTLNAEQERFDQAERPRSPRGHDSDDY